MLRDLKLQTVYSRDNCPDLVGALFVPALSNSVSYDRTTYTFSTTVADEERVEFGATKGR